MARTRTISARRLIQLPSLTAEETGGLASRLLAAAKANTLPANASAALAEVKASFAALTVELHKRGQSAPTVNVSREADIVLDRQWSAVDRLLWAWASVEGSDLAETANRLRARLFPEGLTFLNKNFDAEWMASEDRLGVIDKEGHAATFDQLGAAPFLTALRRAHKAYGQAIGTTQSKEAAPAAPALREARDVLLDDIRVYAAQIAASVSRKKPESEAIAEALLLPITSWSSRRGGAGAGSGDGGGDPVGPVDDGATGATGTTGAKSTSGGVTPGE